MHSVKPIPEQDRLAELLNAPFVPAEDRTVPGKDKVVRMNIFMLRPTELDGFVNMYPVCIGRYDIVGDGKNRLSDLLSAELGRLLTSLKYMQGDVPIIRDNAILCPVDDPAVQYFVSGPRIERRHDDYTLAFRPMTATGAPQAVGPGTLLPGHLVTDNGVMTVLGFAELGSEPARPGNDSKFEFPVQDWSGFEGYYDAYDKTPYIVGIDGVESVSALRNDANLSGAAAPSTAVHVKYKDGKQVNIFNDIGKHIGVFLSYLQPSVQDKFFPAERMMAVLITRDNDTVVKPLQAADESGVMVKADYWQGEILRVSYYKDDLPYYPLPDLASNIYRFSIDHELPNGDKIVKFYKAAGAGTVIRPVSVTVFDASFRPTVYTNTDSDLIIDEVLNGFITRFTVVPTGSGSGDDAVSYERNGGSFLFAVPGDHTGYQHAAQATTSPRSAGYYRDIQNMVKTLGNDIDKVRVYIDHLVVDGIDDHMGFDVNSIGDNEKLIRHIVIIGFDDNLTPLRTEVVYEDIKI